MKPFSPPSPEAVRRLRAQAERRLSPEEFAAYVDAPMSPAELEGNLELIRWFKRRYPTPLGRLRYARRAWLNARARMPPADPHDGDGG